ncbi:MAG: hypothetical protein FWC61_03950 [Proteobacteria bacterium]|nr:hypothetical protein [Pseudomonadota bacterium]
MKNKAILFAALLVTVAFGAASADDAAPEVAAGAAATADETPVVQVIVVDSAAVAKRAAAKTSGPERPSVSANYEATRVGFNMMNVASSQPPQPASAATVQAVAATGAVATTNANLECAIGERPVGNACQRCAQKNNPGVIWKNSGKDCLIEKCADDTYVLTGADTDQPKCLQKCEVWGGIASRAWVSETDNFDVCGSGEFTECANGFNKTNEQTSASEMKYNHCVPNGTKSGACKKDGEISVCAFPNGKAQQACQNGFWGNCTVNQFCKEGFIKADKQQKVFTVNHKKEDSTYVVSCIPKKK